MTPARFTPLAENDLREAFSYYEAKKPELGIEFMERVRKTVDLIEENPMMFPVAVENVRKANVSRFPFALWYVFDGESVIIACLHLKREQNLAVKRARMLEP